VQFFRYAAPWWPHRPAVAHILDGTNTTLGERRVARLEDTDRAAHEIIVNDQHQYVVWPAARRLPAGWRYLGKAGARDELLYYLREMFVETLPAPLLITDGRQPESRWG